MSIGTFVKVKVLVAQLCPTLCDPWTVAHQALLSVEFSGKVYWSGFPFPLPGDLPDSGIKLVSSGSVGGFFITEPPGKPILGNINCCLFESRVKVSRFPCVVTFLIL